MKREIFFYRCPSDETVEVIIHMDKEMLDKVYRLYKAGNIANTRMNIDFCLNIIKEIYYEAERGLSENIS